MEGPSFQSAADVAVDGVGLDSELVSRLYCTASWLSGDRAGTRARALVALAALPIVEIGQRTESEIFIMRATYQAFAKEKAAARQSAEKALELMPVTRSARDGPAALARAAVVHVLLGEPDRALALLDQALSVPSTLLLVGHPDFEPLWAPLRQDPRYRAALAKAAPRD